ncbi:MAG: DUF3016 domain-containing protein [Burkholderiales bacterium]
MRANLYRLLLLLSVGLWTSAAGAAVTVSFINPQNYTDMGRYPEDMKAQMKEIKAHLEYLGQRYLPPDQSLNIEVLDVDLAGRLNFSRASHPVRILRGKADWPSMQLHYVLEADGRVLIDRQEHIANIDYLEHPDRYDSNQSLPYEKRMLDKWFRKRFAEHKR